MGKDGDDSKSDPVLSVEYVLFLAGYVDAGVAGRSTGKSSTALNGVANLVSLGMCFLCGIFVPIGLLASGVRKIAQFLPAYWYTRANEILGNTQSLTQHMRDELFRAYGMQILFTLAFFCAVLSLAKWRQES